MRRQRTVRLMKKRNVLRVSSPYSRHLAFLLGCMGGWFNESKKRWETIPATQDNLLLLRRNYFRLCPGCIEMLRKANPIVKNERGGDA